MIFSDDCIVGEKYSVLLKNNWKHCSDDIMIENEKFKLVINQNSGCMYVSYTVLLLITRVKPHKLNILTHLSVAVTTAFQNFMSFFFNVLQQIICFKKKRYIPVMF